MFEDPHTQVDCNLEIHPKEATLHDFVILFYYFFLGGGGGVGRGWGALIFNRIYLGFSSKIRTWIFLLK